MEETFEKLIELIMNLAPEVWEVMVKQVYVEVIYNIFWFAILITIMILSIYGIKKISKNYQDDEYVFDDDAISGIIVLLLSIVVVMTFIGAAVNIGDSIGILINPEYKAIELLLDLATPGGC